MMTRAQEVAIATAVQQLRPDWDHPGIVAALRAAQAHGTPAEVAERADGVTIVNLSLIHISEPTRPY